MTIFGYSERTLLIKNTAQLLRMPHTATVTALTMLHRYMHAVEGNEFDIVGFTWLSDINWVSESTN